VSSLWTPGGEHPVGRGGDRPRPDDLGDGLAGDEPDDEPDDDLDDLGDVDPELARRLRDELEATRSQLASVPASAVVANHAMGLYELAAIHLMRQPPAFGEASLAIDAMGALVDGLRGRLGDGESTLAEALAQIRLAFVQLKAGSAPGS
jgi:hypothetical protein